VVGSGLRFEIDAGAGVVTLARPEKSNALTWKLAAELLDALRGLGDRRLP